jgi:thiamine pyrophosphokinase
MEKSDRVALVLHGEYASPNDIRSWCAEAQAIVAADGAADVLLDLGITPNFAIGDMDGMRADTLQELGPAAIPVDDQNTTDFQKCLRFCRESLRADRIAVLNFEGSRVDHMLSALCSAGEGVRFVGTDAQILALGAGEHRLRTSPGIRVSLLPLPEASVSASEGLMYDPVGVDFRIGGRDGMSNEASSNDVKLAIASGTLLAFVQRFEGETRW